MQRITRYPLLIKQVLHYTPKSHPDQKDLLAALAHAEQLLTMVNTAAKVADSEWKMSEISGMVDTENIADGVNLDLRSNTRRFGARECLHEGMLFKAKSGRKLYVYLFNDLLLMCEQTGDAASSTTSDSGQGKMYRVYRKPLPLNEILVGDVAPGTGGTRLMLSGEELVFQVMHGQDMVYLKAPDKKSKKTWMQKIEQAVDVCMKAEKDTQRIRGIQWRCMASVYNLMICSHHFAKGPLNLKDCVGTLNVLVLDCQDMALDQSVSRADIFCAVHLDRQRQKTRTATLHVHPREPHRVRWNEPLMFSMRSFDQELSFYVYCYDKYSQDGKIACCGECERCHS